MDVTGPYSELLEILYATPLDEAKWQLFLERFCQITGSMTAMFISNDSAYGIRRLASGGLAPRSEIRQTYDSNYRYTDPVRQAYLRNPRLGFLEGEDLLSQEDLLKSEAFQVTGAPYGLVYFSLIVISISARRHEIISTWRGAGRPILEPEHRQLIEMLLPHLRNVMNICRTLRQWEDRALTAEAMLDANATALILLNEEGSLIYMNAAAHRMVVASDGFTVQNDRPVPTDPSRRSQFAALVAACASPELESPGGALTLARGRQRRPLQVVVTPLRLVDPRRAAVRALVMAADPDKAVVFPDTILRQLYGLTRAETEIANGLLTGFSAEEIARVRQVTIATVRTQMSSLMSKTGARRQSDLMRLLATLPQTVPQTASATTLHLEDVRSGN